MERVHPHKGNHSPHEKMVSYIQIFTIEGSEKRNKVEFHLVRNVPYSIYSNISELTAVNKQALQTITNNFNQ